MAFTYLYAFYLSIIVGLITSLVFTVKGAKAPFRWMGIALAVTMALDLLVLIDWRGAYEAGVLPVMTSVLFFLAYGLVGTIIGFMPAFIVTGVMKLMGRWPPR